MKCFIASIIAFTSYAVFGAVSGASSEKFIESISDIYKSQLNDLVPDMSVLERDPDMPVTLLFCEKYWKGRVMSETLARGLNRHITKFLNVSDRSMLLMEFFPNKLLREAFDMFPAEFASFKTYRDIVMTVIRHSRLLHLTPIDFCFGFLTKLDDYKDYVENNPEEKNCRMDIAKIPYKGWLVTVILTFDDVNELFITHMSHLVSHSECEFARKFRNHPAKWDNFLIELAHFGDSEEYKNGMGQHQSDWTKNVLEHLVHSGKSKMIARQVGASNHNHVLTSICRMSNSLVNLDDHRKRVEVKGTESILSTMRHVLPHENPFYTPELLLMIIRQCAMTDLEQTLTTLPLVCTLFHDFLSGGNKTNIIEKMLLSSPSSATRFITDALQHVACHLTLNRLACPWFICGTECICRLFVLAVTAHPKDVSIDSIFKDYTRGFDILSSESALKTKLRKTLLAVARVALHQHRFENSSQFISFMKIIVALCESHITLNTCPKLPTEADLLASMDILMRDECVANEVFFSHEAIFEFMHCASIPDLERLLLKMCGDVRFNLRVFILRALCKIQNQDTPSPGLQSTLDKLANHVKTALHGNDDPLFLFARDPNCDFAWAEMDTVGKYIIDGILTSNFNAAHIPAIKIDYCVKFMCQNFYPLDDFFRFVKLTVTRLYNLLTSSVGSLHIF